MKSCEVFVLSWSLLGLEDSFISDLVPGFHSFNKECLTPFKSSWFLPTSSHLWLFTFSVPSSVFVFTIGINPITILLLKLGKGNIFHVLFFMWFWTPRVGGLWCVPASPFPSSGPALRWPVFGVEDHPIREALHQLCSGENLMQGHLWCPHHYVVWNLMFSLRGGLVWQSSIITMEGIFRAIHNKYFCEKNLKYFRHWAECYDDLKIKPIRIVYPICHSLVGLTRHTYKTKAKCFGRKLQLTEPGCWDKGKRMGIWKEVGLELNFSLFSASLHFSKAKITSYLYL